MKTLGIILTGLITGFIIMTPIWTVFEWACRLFMGVCVGTVFYAVWGIMFPPNDRVDV